MTDQEIKDYLKELITTNVDICNAVNKLSRKVKKLSKPNKPTLYDLFHVNPYLEAKYIKPDVIHFGDFITDDYKPKQAGDKVVNEQDQKYYLCIKDYSSLVKGGTVLTRINKNAFIKNNDSNDIVFLNFIDTQNELFIPIQQFETLKKGQEVEFTLRNGKTYVCTVKWAGGFYLNNGILNIDSFTDLNQMDFLHSLYTKYKIERAGWPEAPTLEDLTKDLNKLITLPDLTVKETPITDLNKSVQSEKQAKELVKQIEQFTNGWFISKCVNNPDIENGPLRDNDYWIFNSGMKQIQATKASIEVLNFILANDFSRSELEGIKGVLNGMA